MPGIEIFPQVGDLRFEREAVPLDLYFDIGAGACGMEGPAGGGVVEFAGVGEEVPDLGGGLDRDAHADFGRLPGAQREGPAGTRLRARRVVGAVRDGASDG